ncbi:MAG: DUF1707 domain-containing protein [Actinomycetota bacterium]|nr:DUF1707 domain-containing protein [Actinomycetota bacterium]
MHLELWRSYDFGSGTDLDVDELDQRLAGALAARTRADLAVLFDDLPATRCGAAVPGC